MKLLRVVRSPVKGKKWEAQFDVGEGRVRRVSFGAAGMDDFTLTKDAEQARLYRARHEKDLRTGDPTRPGYLSYYILWAGPSMAANISAYKNRFNL
jgi:hypothetical protein